MKIDKFMVWIFALMIISFIGGIFLVTRAGDKTEVAANENVKITVDSTSHNWGTIGLNNGDVEAEFEIKNEGSETLKLSNVESSCMCTTAQIIIEDEQSPVFVMHNKSSYVAQVAPGKSAKLKIVFDPAFHGPSGVGPITRQIKIQTNDPEKSELSYLLTANVTR